MKNTSIVVADNLCKTFADKKVLQNVSFEIDTGKCFGFLGPNGAGKTTTLQLIEGISPPSGGLLRVFNLSLPGHGRQIRGKMGIVPQIDNLDPDFTVLENLRIYGSYFRIPKKVLFKRIDELLDFMQLSDRTKDKPDNLSGGMKRRLTIARALINDPELIVLDEPTTGLDPQVRHLIWSKLRELMSQGKTLLLTTHYMDEAERLCDQLFIMDHGAILEKGNPQDVIKQHVEPYVVEARGDLAAATHLVKSVKRVRLETVGDTLFCYCAAPETIMPLLEGCADIQLLSRSCNLEDVFLKLTGRDLRE